jgi:protein-tyrosine kinase
VQRSTSGSGYENDRSSSIVERAITKLGRTGEAARAQPEPEPLRPEPAALRLTIDSARLAKTGIFTPDSTVNRTTEEFRLIKRAILERAGKAQADGVANANLVMVTSTREGEGKTFVALNLAFGIAAEKDRSVILIDADPAKSSIARYLGIEAAHGLIDLLRDERASSSDALLATSIEGLSVVPSGQRDHLGAELFASDRMGALLQMFCRNSPDSIVIIDAPPVLATSEPSSLARHVDQTILVIEADRTSRAAINEALNLIAICPHIGLVLNKARFRFGAVRFGAYYKTYYKPGKRYAAARH